MHNFQFSTFYETIKFGGATIANPSTFTASGFSFEIELIESNNIATCPSNDNWRCECGNWPWFDEGPFCFTSTGKAAYGTSSRDAEFTIVASFKITPSTAFQAGLISDGDITLTGFNVAGCGEDESGTTIIDCGVLVHANGDTTVNNGNIWGALSAHGTVGGGATAHGEDGKISNAPRADVPAVTPAVLQQAENDVVLSSGSYTDIDISLISGWTYTADIANQNVRYISTGNNNITFEPDSTPAANTNLYIDIASNRTATVGHDFVNSSIYVSGTARLTGDIDNTRIFVDGDIQLTSGARFADNSTIVATGDIEVSGASEFSGTLIAGGNIDFNGGSNSEAHLWANGDVTLNGTGHLTGTVVTSGNIGHNGGIDYTRSTDNDNIYIPRAISRVTWADARFLP